MPQDCKKRNAAKAAIDYIKNSAVIGVGTGSTVSFFIEELAKNKSLIDGVVSSSVATEKLLKEHNIPVVALNSVIELQIYIDGADEATKNKHLIKGGGGALTREKIIAAASKQFICIIDDTKLVPLLGSFPLPVEVVPMAQSYVAREITKLGGQPELRQDFITDNGNVILDIHNFKIENPLELENKLNQITGVVTNGLFAKRPADVLIVASDNEVIKK
ncbi:MAG: ribose-5-phosphate isomerase RpiA [Pseudomonadota bacterium]|nr:ribose-5-phosphate isomerase RpiA [Pseudomonadota bacterium]|tara:strand:- start:166 stop:819 length:654 start_codon:yes stop_codon:yes gene_type:complete